MKANKKFKLINNLKKEVHTAEEDQKLYPEVPYFHFEKAKKLLFLGNITGDNSFYTKALTTINNALDCMPEANELYPLYITYRSMIYTNLGKYGLAFIDLLKIQESILQDKLDDDRDYDFIKWRMTGVVTSLEKFCRKNQSK